MTGALELPIGEQRKQELILSLQELSSSFSEFRSDLNNINDSSLRDTAALLTDAFVPVINAHLAQPKSSIADDIASLMSGVLSVRIPIDDEVGSTPSRRILRRHLGLLFFNLKEVMAAADKLGIRPTSSPIVGSSAEVSRDDLSGKIEALKNRLTNVEHVLSDLEAAGHAPTPFLQQSGLLDFYIGSMRVEINLTKFQLSVSTDAIDLVALTRIMEVMTELTRDFVETARSWVARLAPGINLLVGPLILRFRRLARGVSTVVRSIQDRSTQKVRHARHSEKPFPETTQRPPKGLPQHNAAPSLLAENFSVLRRYARAVVGDGDYADDFLEQTLELLVARQQVKPFYPTKKMLFAEFSRTVKGRFPDVQPALFAQQKLMQLPPLERQVFLLIWLEGFSVEDITDILELDGATIEATQNEVGIRLSRILKTKVLIIEDERFISDELAELFASLGHDIIGIARTAREAISLAAAHRPGLISADIQLMDGSSGLDAVNVILNTEEVPVVFVTAYPERFLTGMRPEPAFLISKPFIPSMLAAVASQALFFNRRARVRPKKS